MKYFIITSVTPGGVVYSAEVEITKKFLFLKYKIKRGLYYTGSDGIVMRKNGSQTSIHEKVIKNLITQHKQQQIECKIREINDTIIFLHKQEY